MVPFLSIRRVQTVLQIKHRHKLAISLGLFGLCVATTVALLGQAGSGHSLTAAEVIGVLVLDVVTFGYSYIWNREGTKR
jgi:ABC-type microcin C transport system duplicated ATPase subunit YejF